MFLGLLETIRNPAIDVRSTMTSFTIELPEEQVRRLRDLAQAVALDHKQTDRRRGAILGLAIGDALGAAVEFQPAGSFPEVTGFRAGGPHGLEPGEWTDDTSMALALADSIAEVGWDLSDQASRYVAWWRSGAYSVNGRVFDIGVTTVGAPQQFRETGDPWTSGDPSRAPAATGRSCGWRRFPWLTFDSSRTSSICWWTGSSNRAVPHMPAPNACRPAPISGAPRRPRCTACRAIRCSIRAGSPARRVHERFPLHPEILEVAQGSFRTRKPPRIQRLRLRGAIARGGPLGVS